LLSSCDVISFCFLIHEICFPDCINLIQVISGCFLFPLEIWDFGFLDKLEVDGIRDSQEMGYKYGKRIMYFSEFEEQDIHTQLPLDYLDCS
jgi:hypothetical protein